VKVKSVEGVLESAGPNIWKLGDELLKTGTVLELCLSGAWLLGLVQRSSDAILLFLSWEDGVEISLRPGLRARALMPVRE
jgi:hypothetical protein